MNRAVSALAVHDDGFGGGPALYAGGFFTTAFDSGDSYLAKWGCPSCTEDVDGDGNIGFGDILRILVAWGPCDACPEDIDHDDVVDFSDVLRVLAAWGSCDDA